ncbi:hypothetical protein [Nesterenkonia ebinurensis]|uniref:hypothetical protein n=1 Tax=Nesterenkonia ebinurensis TaxID=2608252 RepID=UPI00123DB850|nr:hypothetical protein [Nesterenkonia ebinurensis]
MPSQEQDEVNTRLNLRAAQRHDDSPPPEKQNHDDLGVSASNRAVTITLVIGIALMLLVLMLPYLSDL